MSRNNRKYKSIRNKFKKDIYELIKNNNILAISIFNVYTCSKLHTHITQIWSLLGKNHYNAYLDYCDKLSGKCLTGNFDFMRFLYFVDKEIYKKYYSKIYDDLALGVANSVAISYLKKGR